MNTNELIQAVADEHVDIDQFVRLVCCDAQARDEVVNQMVSHPHIMVYYHCFYVVDKASQSRPDLFSPYWSLIAPLLNHPNSYHRDFALTILPNLLAVDQADRFAAIFQDYFAHVHDPKFMTGCCCVQNSLKIIRHKPELRDSIITLLLAIDADSAYKEKQQALLKGYLLEILDQVYAQAEDKAGIHAFIRACLTSPSPRTRKKAKELTAKYGV